MIKIYTLLLCCAWLIDGGDKANLNIAAYRRQGQSGSVLELVLEDTGDGLDVSLSAGSRASALVGLEGPAVLSEPGGGVAAGGAGGLLDVVAHLAASPAESVGLGVSSTESGGTSGHIAIVVLMWLIIIVVIILIIQYFYGTTHLRTIMVQIKYIQMKLDQQRTNSLPYLYLQKRTIIIIVFFSSFLFLKMPLSTNILFLSFIIYCLFSQLAANSGGSSSSSSTSSTTAHVVPISTLQDFSYLDESHWQYIWEQCNPDVYPEQSPINISYITTSCPEHTLINILFEDASRSYHLAGPYLSIPYFYSFVHLQQQNHKTVYQSSAIHFHNKGEHAIKTKIGDMEIHINYQKMINQKHKHSSDSMSTELILAIPVQVDDHASDVDIPKDIFDYVGVFNRETSQYINFNEAFSSVQHSGFYMYKGSLSTPPCLGNITWLVSDHVVKITTEQYELWKVLINKGETNSRSLQPTHNREILYFSAECLQKPLSFSVLFQSQIKNPLLFLAIVLLVFLTN